MTKNKIITVLKEVPDLTDFGIGLFENGRGLTSEEYRKKFKSEQERLIESTEEFERVCQWLYQIDKIKTINNKRGSYGLKHIAEREVGYITNGVFIAAAIHSGFKYKIYPGSPNVSFNMSEKSIKRIEQNIRNKPK